MVTPNVIEIPGSIGSGTDIYAATRVVSLIAGDGTDLTIAAAIAALPADGGLIVVKQGTYPIAASLALADKPIEIVGCGDATILDLGANAIPAFTAAFARKYVIRDMRITGSVADLNRRVVSISAAANVVLSGLTGPNIRTVIEVTGGVAATIEATALRITLLDNVASWFVSANATVFVRASGVEVTGVSEKGGITGTPVVEISESLLSSFNGVTVGPNSIFSGVTFRSLSGQSISVGKCAKITDCHFTAVTLVIPGDSVSVSSSVFDASAAQARAIDVTSPATGPLISNCSFSGATTDLIRVNAGALDTVIQGNTFVDAGAIPRAIDVLAAAFRALIDGNAFTFFATEAVQIATANCVVTNNTGCKVVEVGGANENVYANNTGFGSSTIIGAASRIENYQTLSTSINLVMDSLMRTLLVDASGAARTITLPTAASAKWRKYTVKKTDSSAFTVTIDAAGAETIDGALTVVISVQYGSITIQSDGTTWWIIVSDASSTIVAVTYNEPAADHTAGTQAIFDTVTLGETVVFADLLYQNADGKWYRADADAASTMPGLRMALAGGNNTDVINSLAQGRVRDDSWAWTVGGLIYASTAVGALTQTQPSGTGDQVQVIGVAYHADKMIFDPSPVLAEIV